jgi:NAD(P)-dependent dehydrogenase (short-subunit alcohol dehydrogenase family)
MATTKTGDPRAQEASKKPPFPEQPQEPPGTVSAMRPTPDHGETSYRGSGKLTDCAAIITGADSGIGRAVALAFAREGADVVVSYLEEDEDARQTERLVREAGREAIVVPGDIGDHDHCRQIVNQAVRQFGHVDLLVNNAAFQLARSSIEEIPSSEFEHTYRTNVFGMFYLCQAAIPHMRPGASIINTTSIQGYDPSPELLAYASTKAAIINFTKALAKSAIAMGIRVNAVAPGPVWTPLIPATLPPEWVESFGRVSVFDRPAQPAELAPLFVWLASPEASYITGEVFGATGGRTPY